MELYKKLFFRGDDLKSAELTFAALGGTIVALLNMAAKRPLYAQVYRYPVGMLFGYGAGSIFHEYNYRRLLTKEAIIWDYVEKHPEHFPDVKPKKYKDILDVWHPIR
ncbi:hypothetical protein HELRODRAFT_180594 [Helobdella robusta]|uniref:NADH dehydrogenase [ubiquinone] 1 subunit C2 n=1 Tax=Helobdella robusta TaxID=6412 RepID=T1FG28_HELRO|nr:hypothetical protein HELRODRAFT_180594 [Helobdella robusta]ESN93728.1 hypothetical protein HELRODRAFT_180594 [Helobdella robusta]